MAKQTLNNGETLGIFRGKSNANFTELYSLKLESSQVLTLTNTSGFTPTLDYHPCTKLYADGLFSTWDAVFNPQNISADVFVRANHTGMQDADTITQDSTHRFVSDVQVVDWNQKEDNIGVKGTAFNKSFGTVINSVAEGNHSHTKSDIGLGNVDNTSDVNKPVSTLQQAAIDLKANIVDVYTKIVTDGLLALKRDLTDSVFGTATDNTEFEADGTMIANGSATTWEDVNLDPTTLTGNGTAPVRTAIGSTGLSGAGFANSKDDEVEGKFEYPHKGKLNKTGETSVVMDLHCHFMPVDTAGGNVRLGIEYIITDEDNPATTSTTIEVTVPVGTVAWAKVNMEFSDIIPVSELLGSQVHFRFYRLGGDTLDTYANTIVVTTIGSHIESDMLGSHEETVK